MIKKKISSLVIFILLLFSTFLWAESFTLPSFLPDYYLPAFEIPNQKLFSAGHMTEVNGEKYLYSTEDGTLSLTIDNIKCDRPRAKAIFDNILGALNEEMKKKPGEFKEINEREIYARIAEEDREKTIFTYVLSNSIQIWTYSVKTGVNYRIESKFELIKALANRQRYNEALQEGNVSMGFWGSQIYEYAGRLLREGKKKEGLSVLSNLLATSPFNYRAHIDFMENTTDLAAAKNSAEIVIKNAEDPKLLNKAAKFLEKEPKTLNKIPLLDKDEKKLQVIIIPLEPCSAWFLEDTAELHEKITGIPTKIRRLPDPWTLGTPDRIPYQRLVQSLLVKMKKENIDFTGWNRERYIEELNKIVASEDALTKYYVKELINDINQKEGEYLVDPYLDRFCKILQKYRSSDPRTMYVGVTGVNIYSGDNNFLFSLGKIKGQSPASILSYHMMLAETLSEEYQSRQRLTERLVKELVPASLKQLGIPRSTDPSCPYSYSSGVSRLDQKTLNLSDSVKEALEKIRK